MEIGWWNRDDEGKKYQVHLNLFGGKLVWTWQRARYEKWEPYPNPTEDDWNTAIEQAENRYQRRLIRKQTLDLIRRRGA